MPWYQIKNAQGQPTQKLFADSQGAADRNTPPGGSATLIPQTPETLTTAIVIMEDMEMSLLDRVDQIRNQQQMQYLTRGTSLSLEYVQIQVEVKDYQSLLPNVLGTLAAAVRQTRWPIASMEAELSGKTIQQVFATYIAAINENERHNRIFGRIAVVGKQKIRAATTPAAKLAAYNAINWAWTPSF
jgi:hypothetical protein